MKKSRLLEIVREEIGLALNEYGFESQSKINETQLAEIEQLTEMASMIQLKNQLEKQGKKDELEAVKAAEKATIDKLKENPTFSGEGKDTRLKGYVSALKKELKNTHSIDLQDLLTDVMMDAEAAGDKFKDDIATNTIEKDAAAQILGTEKGQRGRKPSEKPSEKSSEKSSEKDKEETTISSTPKLDKIANDKDSLLKALKSAQQERAKIAEKRKDTEDVKEREKLLDDLKKINKLEGEIQKKIDQLGF